MLLKIVLFFQGFYYSLTGLWAIVSLESFSEITGHYGDGFEMHSIAALAIVLGLAFIFGAILSQYRRAVGLLLLASALAVIVPELVYFSEIKNTLFFWDLIEEIIIAILAGIGLLYSKIKAETV